MHKNEKRKKRKGEKRDLTALSSCTQTWYTREKEKGEKEKELDGAQACTFVISCT